MVAPSEETHEVPTQTEQQPADAGDLHISMSTDKRRAFVAVLPKSEVRAFSLFDSFVHFHLILHWFCFNHPPSNR